MQANLGKTDRIVQVILGAAIVAIGVYNESWWGAMGFGLRPSDWRLFTEN